MTPKFVNFLLIIGVIIISIGIFFIVWATIESSEIEIQSTRPPLQFDYPSVGEFSTGDDDNPSTIKFQFIFETDTEFAVGERFNYLFQAKVGGTQILDKIYIIFETPNIISSEINDENFEFVIDYALDNDLGVELQKKELMNDGSFLFEHGSTYLYTKEQDVELMPITVGKNGEYGPIPKTGSLFTIKPFSEKLHVEAGQESIKSSRQQELDTRMVLGFSIIGISAIPFGISVPILISHRKEEKTNLTF